MGGREYTSPSVAVEEREVLEKMGGGKEVGRKEEEGDISRREGEK